MEVTFKVAMDSEAKKAGNVKDVTLTVSFEGVADDTIQKAALAHAVVGWQSQIRGHWDEFMAGKMPEQITFGVPLFASKRGGTPAPITTESATKYIQGLSPEAKAEMLAALGMTN